MNTNLADKINVDVLLRTYQIKGYKIFRKNPGKNFNLNICVVRAITRYSGKFDDIECVFWEDDNGWVIKKFSCTADPSDISLLVPKNPLGTAIIKEGQYLGCWAYGFHKGDKDHPALVQVKPITVIRDFTKDKILDIAMPNYDFKVEHKVSDWETYTDYYIRTKVRDILVYRTNTGLFGINNHRANKYAITNIIGRWSEGCIVQNDYNRYMNEFIEIIKQSLKYYNNSFTITIINEENLYV